MKFKPPPNRKRVEPPPSSSLSENIDRDRDGRMRIPMGQTNNVKKAQNYAMVEAHQDGCTGNFRTFESVFGNYLVPVIPSRAELDS